MQQTQRVNEIGKRLMDRLAKKRGKERKSRKEVLEGRET